MKAMFVDGFGQKHGHLEGRQNFLGFLATSGLKSRFKSNGSILKFFIVRNCYGASRAFRGK